MRNLRIPLYEVKGYVKGMEEQARNLFSLAYGGREYTQDTWEWIFHNNPFSKENITSLWDGDKLVAMIALTPFLCIYNGQIGLGAQSGTLMARDEYRGVSIQVLTEYKERYPEFLISYGFPNRKAFRIATKFCDEQYIGDVDFWVAKPRICDVKYSFSRIDAFKDAHEDLQKEQLGNYSFARIRTKDYLTWRYLKQPGRNYLIYDVSDKGNLKGYIVLSNYCENGQKHLQIIDCVFDGLDTFNQILKYCLTKGVEAQCDIVKIWMTYHDYLPCLQEMGFTYGFRPFTMTLWNMTSHLAIGDSYLTMGDSDVF